MLSVGAQICLIAGNIAGCIGVHAWEIPIEKYGLYSRVSHPFLFCFTSAYVPEEFSLISQNEQIILAAPLVYAPCCALTKISLCIFYSRLSPKKGFQVAVWTTIFVCAGAYTGVFFSLVFACKPIAASWNPLLLGTAVCVNRGAIYIATAVLGVVTDVVLITIPIPTIWGLQMPMKQKVGLIAIFGIGSM